MPLTSTKSLESSPSSDLFGREDSEFLDALAQVDMPVQKPSTVTKQPSSSSDLFGAEDPDFLDALSKTTIPHGVEQTPKPAVGPSQPTHSRERTLKRKGSHSSEQGISNIPSPGILQPSNTLSKNETTYTDSDIYGASKFQGWGEYMRRKRAKLSIQNNAMEESTGGKMSTLFQGLALYINGKTIPSVQELRKLIIQHGGIFHPYLDRKKMVTHIIASNLTPSKVLEFKHMKVATPAWLLASIEAGALLPWRDYSIGADHRPDESQGKVKSNPDPVSDGRAHELTTIKPSRAETTPGITEHGHEGEPTPSTSKVASGSRPLYTTDPSTTEQATRVPSYAPSGSNPHAKRKMEDPEWRAANTAVAPGFIEGYYKNSRLHHLSTWKTELQDLVAKAAEQVQNGRDVQKFGLDESNIKFRKITSPDKGKEKISGMRVIMHCDFDSFFVSAGLVDRPHLKGKPVVVCHSQGGQGGTGSTSEIASSSYEARKFGIKNGMSLGQAKKLCPNVHTIPYEFERYKHLSLQFYTVLMSYSDDLQAVSVDEALIDVTSTVESARHTTSETESGAPSDFAKDLAETIRARVRQATGCEISIGISHNIMLARIATRRAKPAGSFHIRLTEVSDVLAPLDIDDLWGFGWSTRSKVEAKFGVTSLGDLAKLPKGALCDTLGKKTGETLWKAVRGIDDTKIESDRARKSVSSEINYGIRFNDDADAEKFIRDMAAEVSKRLSNIGMCGRSLTLKIMTRDPEAPVEAPKFLGHGICDTTNKTAPLVGPGAQATSDGQIIGDCAWNLLKVMHFDPKELRGIGIHVQKLERGRGSDLRTPPVSGGQSMLPFRKKDVIIEEAPVTSGKEESERVGVVIDPPSCNEDLPSPLNDAQDLIPDTIEDGLPSISQVDPSFLDALPADIRAELEREYTRLSLQRPIAGPSRHKSPEAHEAVHEHPPKQKPYYASTSVNLARITRQFAPKSRPSVSPSKQMHPLFAKRKASTNLKVSAAELKLLDIDPDVWIGLPAELQREQLAALRAANVGTGMAIRASMSTQAKQDRTLSRWRALQRRSPPVGVRGRRPEIFAKTLELPRLKQRGKSQRESNELRISETEDLQAVIGQWVCGFEDDGPRLGDVEYFGKFLERCCGTDVGAEKAVSALKWWRILLRQRWADLERLKEEDDVDSRPGPRRAGWDWWHAFWGVKIRMDDVMRKRFGGSLSLK